VAQRVRAASPGDPGPRLEPLEDLLHSSPIQSSAPAQEERSVCGTRTALSEVADDRSAGGRADRHDPPIALRSGGAGERRVSGFRDVHSARPRGADRDPGHALASRAAAMGRYLSTQSDSLARRQGVASQPKAQDHSVRSNKGYRRTSQSTRRPKDLGCAPRSHE
jgi:hypothetical protein